MSATGWHPVKKVPPFLPAMRRCWVKKSKGFSIRFSAGSAELSPLTLTRIWSMGFVSPVFVAWIMEPC